MTEDKKYEFKRFAEIKKDIATRYVNNFSENKDQYLKNDWIDADYPDLVVLVHDENMHQGYTAEDVLSKGNILIFANESENKKGVFVKEDTQWKNISTPLAWNTMACSLTQPFIKFAKEVDKNKK